MTGCRRRRQYWPFGVFVSQDNGGAPKTIARLMGLAALLHMEALCNRFPTCGSSASNPSQERRVAQLRRQSLCQGKARRRDAIVEDRVTFNKAKTLACIISLSMQARPVQLPGPTPATNASPRTKLTKFLAPARTRCYVPFVSGISLFCRSCPFISQCGL